MNLLHLLQQLRKKTPKDPGRIAAGKKLAEYNKKAREAKKAGRENKGIPKENKDGMMRVERCL